jgi:hypothetical protein
MKCIQWGVKRLVSEYLDFSTLAKWTTRLQLRAEASGIYAKALVESPQPFNAPPRGARESIDCRR